MKVLLICLVDYLSSVPRHDIQFVSFIFEMQNPIGCTVCICFIIIISRLDPYPLGKVIFKVLSRTAQSACSRHLVTFHITLSYYPFISNHNGDSYCSMRL